MRGLIDEVGGYYATIFCRIGTDKGEIEAFAECRTLVECRTLTF